MVIEHKIFILMSMIFLHIVDDFHLQGILCNMKQKRWWTKQEGYSPMYRRDYIVCLLMHSFSWSFMIMLPCAIASWDSPDFSFLYISMFIVNLALHALVDHLKANEHMINLIQDQICHLVQIVVTFIVLMM